MLWVVFYEDRRKRLRYKQQHEPTYQIKEDLKKEPKLKKDGCGTAAEKRGRGKTGKGGSKENQKAF